jgi:AraC family transcriptional regulator
MYGEVTNRLDLPGSTLFETVYRHPVLEPLHEHPHPYVAVLLKGNYCEAYRRGEAHFVPFTAVFHPANAQHSCVLNEPGCRFFTLELETSWIQSMRTMVQANSVFDWHGERLLWLMLRLLREFRDRRARLPLTMESLILEMLAALGDERHIGPRLPLNRWKILQEKIHDSFQDSIRTRDLARAAGIHPVHVARLFRLKAGVTPGEYLQHLRAQYACRLMQDPERSLGDIASQSGFADQSHMNRILRRLVHCTPGMLRADLRQSQTSNHAFQENAISQLSG